jgi:hypothetical protein
MRLKVLGVGRLTLNGATMPITRRCVPIVG